MAEPGARRLTLVEPAPRPDGLYSDLLDVYDNRSSERPWFAEGAIEGNPIVVLSGPEKSGKSWIAQELAVATVLGLDWMGKFPIRHPGEVVYADSEYGEHEMARRIARIARGMGQDPREALRRFRHCYATGLTLKEGDPELRALVENCGEHKPALVVLDPFRNSLDGSENDQDVINRAFRCLCHLRDAAECPLVVVHHLNKSGSYSGSRSIATRADLLLDGSDKEVPTYSTRGRTLRTTIDPIAKPFSVKIEHTDEHDEDLASTVLTWTGAEGDAGKGGNEKCSAAQLAKVRAAVETFPVGASCPVAEVIAAIEDQNGKGVAKQALYEGMRILQSQGVLEANPPKEDPETGNLSKYSGWCRCS